MKPPRLIPIPTEGPTPVLVGDTPAGAGPRAVLHYLDTNLHLIHALFAETQTNGLVLLTGPVAQFDGLYARVAPAVEAQLAHCVATCRAAGAPNLSLGVNVAAALLAVLVRSGIAETQALHAKYCARGDKLVVVVLLAEGTGSVLVSDEGVVLLTAGGSA